MDVLAIPAVRVFAFWYLILAAKMLVLIFLISRARMRAGVFVSPEDYAMAGRERPLAPVPDEHIERLRRALANDVENILPFFGIGLLYALSGPSLIWARILLAGFAVARIVHTVAYVRGMQPHRSLAFVIGMVCLWWMLLVALWSVL
ncbi:MAG TPA: MAPEG family protein [Candidatus Binatia bacterium]